MKALIFSGGEFSGLPEDFTPQDFDCILAADKGYLYAKSLGIVPHIFVGDRDSLPDDVEISSGETVLLTPIKDMTDTQEAIDIAISRGATEISIVAALGGRADHALANLHLLKYGKDRGATVSLTDKNSFITLIDSPASFPRKEGFCLSLIPLTHCEHVSVSGVFYPLSDAIMALGHPYGVSNEFTEDVAYVNPGTGELFVMICKSI
ncbi:MAG: thiamine diphosphokinase [Clostridia bacterium]|nr:thiamine diphosphokinase [Clostridia bacterium]